MKQEVFNKYVKAISSRFRLSENDMFSKTKKRSVVDSRHLLYYLCAKRPMRIVDIQDYMLANGYKINHSSVIYGINMLREKMDADRDYVNIIKQIEESVSI